MRRTEAREAVRMAVFLNLLRRWESAELNQEGLRGRWSGIGPQSDKKRGSLEFCLAQIAATRTTLRTVTRPEAGIPGGSAQRKECARKRSFPNEAAPGDEMAAGERIARHSCDGSGAGRCEGPSAPDGDAARTGQPRRRLNPHQSYRTAAIFGSSMLVLSYQ